MANHDDLVYVRHILGAIGRIQSYTAGMTLPEFLSHPMAQDAIIRQFEIIGEAAKKVSRPFRESHGEIPWGKMAGMRDVLIHGYEDVDLDIVWTTVHKRLPGLVPLLRQLVGE